jgi:colanic acid/amylovoran biosynthesis protein
MHRNKQQRIILFGGGLQTGNLGVGALTVGAIRCMLAAYPQAEISLLEYGRTSSSQCVRLRDRVVEVPVTNLRFSWKLYLPNNIALLLIFAAFLKLIPSHRLRGWLTSKNKCLSEICEADQVMSIAGGDSFADIYGLWRLLYVALPQILALFLGKNLVLLPQTIGPFRKRLSRAIAGYIVQRAEHVYSRDRQGLAQLQELMGRDLAARKTSFCYDVAFVMDPIAPDKIEIDGMNQGLETHSSTVGVNISGLLYMGGYTKNNMFGLRADYRRFIHRLIDFLIVQKGASVILVPHVIGRGGESDVEVCERVYEELQSNYPEKLGVVRRSYDHSEMKYIIGQCDFFVGSRMHSCIGAASQCIPAVSVAYSDKFIGVMEALNIDYSVADARRLTEEELLGVVDRVYEGRKAMRQQLERKMLEVQREVMTLLGGLAESRPHKAYQRQPAALNQQVL